MSLYYQDEQVTLYHGDCLTEHREWLTADILVSDPPYGSQLLSPKNGKSGGYGRKGRTIANDLTTEARDEVLRLWGPKPALVFGSPRMEDPPGRWADRLVWDKKRLGMNGGPWRYRHESIFVTEGFIRTSNANSSVIAAFPNQDDHIHAKPLPLMTSLVACAPPGVIADPFAGSGSTLVAAANLGRKVIGVEIEERYCELIVKRLAQGALDFGDLS